jgi:hypothetical protein
MTNINRPNGFRQVGYAFGRGGFYGNARKYYYAGAGILGVGDPVVRVTGSTDPLGICAMITRATTGSYVTGHIVGFDPVPDALTQVGYLNMTAGYVYVCDDPDAEFEVQEGGSGTALAITNIGQSINAITAVNANTVVGSSIYQIDNATVSTSASQTYVITGLVQRADNAVGQYAKWLVRVNLSTEAVSGASNVLPI